MNNFKKMKTEGEDLKLACPAKGRPRPDIIWYKDNDIYHQRSSKVCTLHFYIPFNAKSVPMVV